MPTKLKWLLLVALLIPCWVIGIKYEIDLVVLHATAQFINHDYTRVYAQNGNLGRYFYGPFSLVLIKPLGYFSFSVIKYFWLCLQTVCYFLFWKILQDLYPFLKENKYIWGWLLVWIVAINPIHNNFQSNNIQLMLATLLLAAEQLTRSSSATKQAMGGLLVTFAAGIKVFPAFLVIYYFLAKNWTCRRGILVGLVVVLAAPFLCFGGDQALFLYKGFYSNLTTYSVENGLTQVRDILCLPSLLARFGVTDKISKAIILGLSALFYLWVLKARPLFNNQRTQGHFLAMAWSLSVFLNPSTRPHYFIFYVPAFCSIVEIFYAYPISKIWKFALALSTLMIAFTAQGVTGRKLNEVLEFSNVPTYGMLLLCLVLAAGISIQQKSKEWKPSEV
jgi:alpha-1,2-mannosyltransferase